MLESQTNKSVPWTAGHIQTHYDIAENYVEIRVQKTALVTNCHPYQLPCPDDPFHCQLSKNHRISTTYGRFFQTFGDSVPWVILAILVTIVLLLLAVVYTLRRKINRIRVLEINSVDPDIHVEASDINQKFTSQYRAEQPARVGNEYSNSVIAPHVPRTTQTVQDSELYCIIPHIYQN